MKTLNDQLSKETGALKKALKEKGDLFKKDLDQLQGNEKKTDDELKKTEKDLKKYIAD